MALRIRKLGVPVAAEFPGLSGVVDLAADPAACRVVAVVAAAGFRTRNPRRDRHVAGPAFLDACRYPDLRFDSTALRPTGPGRWTCEGVPTMRDVSRSLTFDIRLRERSADGAVVATASTALRRSTFGVNRYRWLAGDAIGLTVTARAVRMSGGLT